VIQAKPITDEMQQADEAEASADEEAGADDASEQTTEEEPSDTEPFPMMAPFIDRDTQEVLDQLRAMGSPGETACYDYFQSEGVDLTQYNTTNSIHDLMALMQALDYDLYNIYGISYGSRLALELLRAYGDTEAGADLPAIRSIAIDGIDPPHIDSVTQSPLATMYITLRLLSDCEAEDACGAAYPDIRGRALELLAQAKDTPLEIAGSEGTTQTVTLDNLSSLLTGATVTDEEDFKHIGYEEIVPYLPALVDELSRGIGDTYIGLKQGILPLEPDAEGPENASIFDPLALRSQKLSDDAQTLAAELAVLSAQAQRSSGALDGEESLPEFFTRELVHLANEQSSFEGLGGFGRLIFQTFATQEPNRETLAAIIDFLELDEVGQATLNGIVSLMDDEQVVATVELVVTDRVLEQLIQALQIQMNTAVTCNDLYGQFDAVSAVEDYRNLEAPSLLLDPALLITYIARCERYQLTAGAGESTEPVVRDDDIPILIVNGSIDATTPAEWGMATAENLPGAQLVTIPMLDHGATAKSACGQDIVRFFFTYPDQEVNDDCIEALKPVFVLPDDQ
jgi:pimeloyl-ACP methyl ester carboxylesterase